MFLNTTKDIANKRTSEKRGNSAMSFSFQLPPCSSPETETVALMLQKRDSLSLLSFSSVLTMSFIESIAYVLKFGKYLLLTLGCILINCTSSLSISVINHSDQKQFRGEKINP